MDCRHFAPLDVVRGACQRTAEEVLADEPGCEDFDRLPRCRHCARFAPGEGEDLGVCEAVPTRPMAYPDLAAVTCRFFAWREEA
jgi:hypothetical protein